MAFTACPEIPVPDNTISISGTAILDGNIGPPKPPKPKGAISMYAISMHIDRWVRIPFVVVCALVTGATCAAQTVVNTVAGASKCCAFGDGGPATNSSRAGSDGLGV